MRLRPWLALGLLLVLAPRARADDPLPGAPPAAPGGDDDPAPPPPGPDPGEALYRKAVEQQAKEQWKAAQKTFKKLIEQFPDSKYVEEAEDRSAPNAFLGVSCIREGGPPERRLDVALMGDGYMLEDQNTFEKHAKGELDLLFGEPLYAEYESYFNVWCFRLASKEDGVDAGGPPEPVDPTDKKKYKRHIREFSTALNCKAAGPQGQVMADRGRVNHYLRYLPVNDGQTIAFAQKGILGMGGGGLATTGPKGVVVHEFGHGFLDLLDEYQNQPGPPPGQFSAANATTDPKNPPWKHFLAKKVPGVDVIEGGATYQKGVWRPAPSCAMNVGGGRYCPVCREAGVLRIYDYVSPIDEALPEGDSAQVGPGLPNPIVVVPMRPKTHALEVEWFARPIRVKTQDPEKKRAEEETDSTGIGMQSKQVHQGPWRGNLRISDGPRTPLRGERLKDLDKREKGGRVRHSPDVSGLKPGRYEVTVVVRDTTQIPGEPFPWVIKDAHRLLEERRSWTVDVVAASSPTPSPPAMDR
jgi:hypothetical protein